MIYLKNKASETLPLLRISGMDINSKKMYYRFTFISFELIPFLQFSAELVPNLISQVHWTLPKSFKTQLNKKDKLDGQ